MALRPPTAVTRLLLVQCLSINHFHLSSPHALVPQVLIWWFPGLVDHLGRLTDTLGVVLDLIRGELLPLVNGVSGTYLGVCPFIEFQSLDPVILKSRSFESPERLFGIEVGDLNANKG